MMRIYQWSTQVLKVGIIAIGLARVVAAQGSPEVNTVDSSVQLRFHGYLQADARWSEGHTGSPATSAMLLRRVRPVLDGTLAKRFDFRVVTDLGGGKVVLIDAYNDITLWPALVIRAGKFVPPVGIEQIQSSADLRFVERGLPTNLVPNRDLGVQVGGELLGGTVSYQAGLFDGVPDLGNGETDVANSKDVAGRIFLQPFQGTPIAAVVDLGFGIAASSGHELGTLATPQLASYLSPGQTPIFKYRTDGTAINTVIADGARTRVSPQGYVNAGPFGVLAEYVRSSQRVRRNTTYGSIDNDAWQVMGSWLLTGERNSFKTITPKKFFDPAAGTWGAWEVTARYGVLRADQGAFPVFADSANSVRRAAAWAAGVNWHLARGVKIVTNYERTTFQGGAAGADRKPETFVVTRLQTAF